MSRHELSTFQQLEIEAFKTNHTTLSVPVIVHTVLTKQRIYNDSYFIFPTNRGTGKWTSEGGSSSSRVVAMVTRSELEGSSAPSTGR